MIYIFAICNLVKAACSGLFLLMLYGRGSSVVHKWSFIGHWSLKVGLASFAAGALLTALRFEQATVVDVMRAVGAALIWMWACVFHYKYFVKYGKQD